MESNPDGVQIRRHRYRTPLVGGINNPVERFGGVLAGGQHADVIHTDQVAAADPGDRPRDGPVHFRFTDGGGEGFEGEPLDSQVGFDRRVC